MKTRAQRRHNYRKYKARARRKYAGWDDMSESMVGMLANTNIWLNLQRRYGRPAKPSDRKADLSYREQLKEASLQEAA